MMKEISFDLDAVSGRRLFASALRRRAILPDWDEYQHPRGVGGRFVRKPKSSPVGLVGRRKSKISDLFDAETGHDSSTGAIPAGDHRLGHEERLRASEKLAKRMAQDERIVPAYQAWIAGLEEADRNASAGTVVDPKTPPWDRPKTNPWDVPLLPSSDWYTWSAQGWVREQDTLDRSLENYCTALAHYFGSRWALGAEGDESIWLSMQSAIARELDVDDAYWPGGPDMQAIGDNLLDAEPDTDTALRVYFRSVYDETQAFLKDNEIDNLVLYRGMRKVPDKIDESSVGSTMQISSAPASSWSSNEAVAGDFSKSFENSAIFAAEFPAESILSVSYVTGLGATSEHEVLALGGQHDVTLAWSSATPDETMRTAVVDELADQLAPQSEEPGGFTFQPMFVGQPKTGFALSRWPEHEFKVPVAEFTQEMIGQYMEKHWEMFSDPAIHVGAYVDIDTDGVRKVFIDLSEIVEDETTARRLARWNTQLAIYDLGTGSLLPTMDPQERLERERISTIQGLGASDQDHDRSWGIRFSTGSSGGALAGDAEAGRLPGDPRGRGFGGRLTEIYLDIRPDFRDELHPRDRLGRFRETPDLGKIVRERALRDPAAERAFRALSEHGDVFVVGGAVRDTARSAIFKDVDLMARVHPDLIESALSAVPGARLDFTGKDFGVFRFRYGASEVEIALPRTEVSTGAGHKDFEVVTDHTLPVEEDLRRRDFTANAMAVNLATGRLHDPFQGAKDLSDGILSTVSPDSFRDDPLRIVRALMSVSRFGLWPDDGTLMQMHEHADKIQALPQERVYAEMMKIFSGADPTTAIRLAHSSGVLRHIVPEAMDMFGWNQRNPWHEFDVGEHTMRVLESVSQQTPDPVVRLAAFFHDSGKPASMWLAPKDLSRPEGPDNPVKGRFYRGPDGQGDDHWTVGANIARKALRRMTFPNETRDRVAHLVEHHMFDDFDTPRGARRFIARVGGPQNALDLIIIRRADRLGKGEDVAHPGDVDEMERLVRAEIEAANATSLRDLAINGRDLIDIGFTPGPELGVKLRELLDAVIEDPSLNERATLLEMARPRPPGRFPRPPERMEIKGAKKLTKPQVLARAKRVLSDVRDFFESDKNVDFQIWEDDDFPVESDARVVGEPGNQTIIMRRSLFDQLQDPGFGVMPLRQVAHEAMHAYVSGTDYVYDGISKVIEEGASEILSMAYWHVRGQEMDHRDATRLPPGRWTDPGIESLAYGSIYEPYVAETLRRAASKVGGWDDAAEILNEVERVFRGDHSARISWRDETDPDFPLPDGLVVVNPYAGLEPDPDHDTSYDGVGKSLMNWLLRRPEINLSEWQEHLHPRGSGGRFTRKFKMPDVSSEMSGPLTQVGGESWRPKPDAGLEGMILPPEFFVGKEMRLPVTEGVGEGGSLADRVSARLQGFVDHPRKDRSVKQDVIVDLEPVPRDWFFKNMDAFRSGMVGEDRSQWDDDLRDLIYREYYDTAMHVWLEEKRQDVRAQFPDREVTFVRRIDSHDKRPDAVVNEAALQRFIKKWNDEISKTREWHESVAPPGSTIAGSSVWPLDPDDPWNSVGNLLSDFFPLLRLEGSRHAAFRTTPERHMLESQIQQLLGIPNGGEWRLHTSYTEEGLVEGLRFVEFTPELRDGGHFVVNPLPVSHSWTPEVMAENVEKIRAAGAEIMHDVLRDLSESGWTERSVELARIARSPWVAKKLDLYDAEVLDKYGKINADSDLLNGGMTDQKAQIFVSDLLRYDKLTTNPRLLDWVEAMAEADDSDDYLRFRDVVNRFVAAWDDMEMSPEEYRDWKNDALANMSVEDMRAFALWKVRWDNHNAALRAVAMDSFEAHMDSQQQARDELADLFERRRKLIIEKLSEIRPLGGTIPLSVKPRGKSKRALVVDAAQRAVEIFPSEWIDRLTALDISHTQSRARYRLGDLTVSASDKPIFSGRSGAQQIEAYLSVAAHEMTHAMEAHVPGLGLLEEAYHHRRTKGEDLTKMNKVRPDWGYGQAEVTKEDQFLEPYMGKVYGDNYWEILTMGVQELVAGEWNYQMMLEDPDYSAFTLGVLAAL